MSGPFDYFQNFGLVEDYLWDNLTGDISDSTAQALYHAAYFSPGERSGEELSAVREAFHDYMNDHYGIDVNAEFDWDTWREAYAAA